MSEPISHHHADLGDVRLHYVTAGTGVPVVLLHGWPQSWYEWRHVIPRLAETYRVIAPDLRGLGDSSRPLDGYDKKTVGNDVWRLVHERLGIEAFFLVGHDWGGPTAYALAAAHPDAVRKLAILDVTIPGDGSPNISQGGRRWHHALHQTPDLPEALIAGREDIYLGWFYRNYGRHPTVIPEGDIAEYLRTYRQPGALRAGFAYYRAIPRDIADNEAIARTFKLPMPVLALGGDCSWASHGGFGVAAAHGERRARRGDRGVRAFHAGGAARAAAAAPVGVLRRGLSEKRFQSGETPSNRANRRGSDPLAVVRRNASVRGTLSRF